MNVSVYVANTKSIRVEMCNGIKSSKDEQGRQAVANYEYNKQGDPHTHYEIIGMVTNWGHPEWWSSCVYNLKLHLANTMGQQITMTSTWGKCKIKVQPTPPVIVPVPAQTTPILKFPLENKEN